MARMIFVNLPVKSAKASKAFFEALGFGFNPMFSNDDTTCIVIEENIIAMLIEHKRFGDFVKGKIADVANGPEALIALSASSKGEVDSLKAKALANGGGEWLPNQDLGFMYGCSFTDLDGHVWEAVWMDPKALEGGGPPQ